MNNKNFKPTTVNSFFYWLEQNIRSDALLYETAHNYLEKERAATNRQDTSSAPFLSVVMRTQGKRPDMLAEVLLCLTGQSNTDFELLIMGHKLNEEQNAVVSGIIADLPDWMREKTRLIHVEDGTRTTPLNRGFEEARGRYIAVLDDDDLIFDNWVEAFYELYQKNDGKILHTYTVLQDWETVGASFPNTPRAAAAPSNIFCCDFVLLDELRRNVCPLCALAFPAYPFKEWGIRFDETLTTTEDWDYLMRCAFLTGVANSNALTFVYRNWLNAENSATVHKKQEWEDNYKRIVTRFSQTPIIMPEGALNPILNLNSDKKDMPTAFEVECFYDYGKGFSQGATWKPDPAFEDEMFRFSFRSERGGVQEVVALRFDPKQLGFCTVSNLLLRVVFADGSTRDFSVSDVSSNGYVIDQKLIFLKSDPQIILQFGKKVSVEKLLVAYDLLPVISDEDLDAVLPLAKPKKKGFIYRLLRKIYRCFKRLIKR